MALRRLAPRFIDWRLSRIDEELDRISCCSDIPAPAPTDPGSGSSSPVSAPPSPPLPPPPPQLLLPPTDDSSDGELPPPEPAVAADTAIYSNAGEWRKAQLERSAADDERDALRFIKEKYDSLGKLIVDKPTSSVALQQQQQQPVIVAEAQAASGVRRVDQHASELYENVPSRRPEMLIPTGEGVKVNEVSPVVLAGTATTSRTEQRTVSTTPRHVCRCANQQRPQNVDEQRPEPHHPDQHSADPGGEDFVAARSLLTDSELLQVDLFYRSYRTAVYVCTCMATLSFSRPVRVPVKSKSKPRPTAAADLDDGVWACVRTGIPIVVRDFGDGRRRRRLYVLLAERGTGFELWRAPVDRLADYAVTSAELRTGAAAVDSTVICSQHTLRLAIDETMSVTARLAFDDQPGADEFHRQLFRLATADDDDDTGGGGGGGAPASRRPAAAAAASKSRRGRGGRLSKSDISQPCCFSHVTRLERGPTCRGAGGMHIVVVTAGCQLSGVDGLRTCESTASGSADSTSPDVRRIARHYQHSSFKANRV